MDSRTEAARKRFAEADKGLRRLQDAIKAGANPAALVEAINAAHEQREAARNELANTPARETLTAAEVHAMIDSLGDVGAALSEAKPESLSKLYESLDLELHYKPRERAVEVKTTLRVANACVRGRSCELFTRLSFDADDSATRPTLGTGSNGR